MSLPTQSNQFLFSLPTDFISTKIEERWMPFLKKNRSVYTSVLDYLNSSIRGLTFPSVSIDSSKQNRKRKEISWRPVTNFYDTFTREVDITFQSVDSNLNHLIMLDAVKDSYLDTEKNYVEPLTLAIVDVNRDVIANVYFRSVNIRSLSEVPYSFADIAIEDKTFTMQIVYNYLEVDFLLGKVDIITDDEKGVPPKRTQMN